MDRETRSPQVLPRTSPILQKLWTHPPELRPQSSSFSLPPLQDRQPENAAEGRKNISSQEARPPRALGGGEGWWWHPEERTEAQAHPISRARKAAHPRKAAGPESLLPAGPRGKAGDPRTILPLVLCSLNQWNKCKRQPASPTHGGDASPSRSHFPTSCELGGGVRSAMSLES